MFSPFAKPKFREKLVAWFFAFLFLDALVNFFTVHGNLLRRVNANAHLITFHAQHGDSYFITDHQGLSDPASESAFLSPYGFQFRTTISLQKNGASPANPTQRLHPSIDQSGQKESSSHANQKRRKAR
jgi:hypothetical protein